MLDPSKTPPLVKGNFYNRSPFRIEVPHRPILSDFGSRIFSIGSCFANHVSKYMEDSGFHSFYCRNTGFHYTTKTLMQVLRRWETGLSYGEEDLYLFKNGLKCLSLEHFELYSFGEDAQTVLMERIEELSVRAHAELSKANIIVLTLGNATYLRHRRTGKVVCKLSGMPMSEFDIELMSVEEIVDDLTEIYRLVRSIGRDDAYFIVTVSPQRYQWKLPVSEKAGEGDAFYSYEELDQTFVHSSLDKAKLRTAVDQFMRLKAGERVEYFPSYEIVIDELRNEETFSFDYNDDFHVSSDYTPRYVIDRFLSSHLSEPMKELLWFRRESVSVKLNYLVKTHGVLGDNIWFYWILIRLRSVYKRMPCRGVKEDALEIFRLYGEGSFADRLNSALEAPLSTKTYLERIGFFRSDRHFPDTIIRAIEKIDAMVVEWRAERKPVVLYGASSFARFLMLFTRLSEMGVSVCLDRNPELDENDSFCGVHCALPEMIESFPDAIVIITPIAHQIEASKLLVNLGVGAERLVELFDRESISRATLEFNALMEWIGDFVRSKY